MASKWKNIGVLVGVDSDKLNAVEADNSSLSQDCLREMLTIFVKQVKPLPSLSAIADALESLGEQKLADDLRTA